MNAAARLARDQQTLLSAIFRGHSDDALWALVDVNASGSTGGESLARRGLQAYQSHGLALAERALGAAYPVIAQLMGAENFAALSPHFWRSHPPVGGDMGQWGDGLANFLADAPQLADEPFLADVACIEWALHRAAFAADSSPDLASFGLLSAEPPAMPSLQLSPGVWLLDSAYPVVSVIQAHGLPLADRKPALAHAADLLARGTGEKALVWREGFKPSLRQTGTAEYALLLALQAGHSLEAALAQADRAEDKTGELIFDFADWLAHAVKSGLVTGACLIHYLTDNNKEASP
jgi:Putative DNA-binding domain